MNPACERTWARRIIVVGGGASGVLLACHLLRDGPADLRVTLIEKRHSLGCGVAYGTGNADHILNVRAANMSAFFDEPNHFWKWLVASGEADGEACCDPFCFVPRRIYGRYLRELIEAHLRDEEHPDRLRIVHGEAIAIADVPSGVALTLADGTTQVGHIAVLATGHDALTTVPHECATHPWDEAAPQRIDPEAPVLILGTGLTMVDYVLSLLRVGHRGPIYALSRHGLLPQVHRRVEPLHIDSADVPLGTDPAYVWRWLRGFVAWHIRRGGDWRSAVDAIRPYTRDLWQNWSPEAKRRFLKHARPWWDVHRHRMAPEVATRLQAVIARGQLRVLAARIISIEPEETGALVRFRRCRASVAEELSVARVVECKGVITDPSTSRNPILQDLFAKRLARSDRLGIGLDVSNECALIDASGKPSRRLYAVGPLTRAAFWEIIAIPDIRVQCADLTRRLIDARLPV